ncbi:MAG: hypothetical protein HY660_02085 [Armatimonadetes bacterium]|nr:hypothetical protein [Armatimonadota bacterium]
MSGRAALLLAALVAAAAGSGGASAQPAAPSIFTVVAADPPARTLVKLAPGFAAVFQFDRAITRVALGDDRLVAFHVDADRGDLTMKPVASSGRTNMVVWTGPGLTLWELVITRDERTADVIRVVSAPRPEDQGTARPASSPAAPASTPSTPGTAPAPASAGAGPGAGANSAPAAATQSPGAPRLAPGSVLQAPAGPQEPAPSFLQASAQGDGVEAIFQAVRVRWGVVVRYRVRNRNTEGTRFRIQPERILVRAHDRIVPYALVRQPAAQAPRDVLAPGATETGMMTVPGRMTQLQVLFPIFPDGPGLPVMLEAGFTGLHRLVIQPEP